jgi:hypothetical protein
MDFAVLQSPEKLQQLSILTIAYDLKNILPKVMEGKNDVRFPMLYQKGSRNIVVLRKCCFK